ncbi:hypothetical protein ACI3WX_000478 [Escherichia coli]|uniref:hypothetical protein n=1 Tax=Escherichia coli TaxID=562 RepID=UPI000BE5879D|nr:hypothetical protein [Escherichia coli]EEQ2597205.1 hypothetical protein [Escherichia coli]EEQ4335269.1 hypothetical protein [Escherichia coli]EEQ9544283.1 hypothetical protein [Escherichia coli]EEQ9574907.1 hypothetical protein [Escherichia coli]EER2012190.1 hypothetical protein [Escherichia coli]
MKEQIAAVVVSLSGSSESEGFSVFLFFKHTPSLSGKERLWILILLIKTGVLSDAVIEMNGVCCREWSLFEMVGVQLIKAAIFYPTESYYVNCLVKGLFCGRER